MYSSIFSIKRTIAIALAVLFSTALFAQNEMDGLMMQKKYLCAGASVGNNSWKNYWEGTYKRTNANLGTVSSSYAMLMGNYGITNKLNVIVGLPYIKTKASAGQLAGQKGFQDVSMFIKWNAIEKKVGKKGLIKLFGVAGYSTPVSRYTADLLPLSIGLKSRTVIMRLMIDYERNNWFATISGAYNYRNNITLDRNTYYTTKLHYTNEVFMPNTSYFNLRTGYRSNRWIVEAIADNYTTLDGGFDITKNNMPFVSNTMNFTRVGLHIKYEAKFLDGLSFTGDANTTLAGRNVGQSSAYDVGIYYIIDFAKKNKPVDNITKK